MIKKLVPFFFAGVCLYSCGSSKNEELLPAYHNPTVQPLTDSIQGDPDNAGLYFLRAEALSKINNDSLALIDVQKARSLDGKNPQYSFTIGYLQLQLGHADAAIKTLLENLKESPGNVNTRMLLAQAYLTNQKVEESKQQINQILAAAPQHIGAMIMQAKILAAQKDTVNAINTLQHILQIDPGNYQASSDIADLYSNSNNDKAVSQYLQTFQLDTMDVTPLYDLASFYETRKDFTKAKDMYATCILKDRDFTDAYVALGKIFLQEKNTEKALRHFNLAIATKPNDAESYYLKGKCFETLRQKDSAIVAYNQALVFDASLQEAREGLKRMK